MKFAFRACPPRHCRFSALSLVFFLFFFSQRKFWVILNAWAFLRKRFSTIKTVCSWNEHSMLVYVPLVRETASCIQNCTLFNRRKTMKIGFSLVSSAKTSSSPCMFLLCFVILAEGLRSFTTSDERTMELCSNIVIVNSFIIVRFIRLYNSHFHTLRI